MFTRFYRDREGVVAILGAAVLGVAALASGAALDYSSLVNLRIDLREATDAAALAAARAEDGKSQDYAESMFDVVLDQGGHRLSSVERVYTKEDGVHIMTASAELKTYILGIGGRNFVQVAAESAAVLDRPQETDETAVPCLHVGGAEGEQALVMEQGATLSGDGCILVLESDDPSQLTVHRGSLDMAGFCVNGGADPVRAQALSARLGLAHMPDACSPIEFDTGPDPEDCENGVFDPETSLFEDSDDPDWMAANGGVYCGFKLTSDPNYPRVTLLGDVIETKGALLYFERHVFELDNHTFVASGEGADMAIVSLYGGYINAPETGPLAGIAILQRKSAAGQAIYLLGDLDINGRIVAEGGVLNVPQVIKPLRMKPTRVGSLVLQGQANVTIEADAIALQAIQIERPQARLVR